MTQLSKPLRLLLIGSLALNLIGLGFVIGHFAGPRRDFGGPPPMSGPASLFDVADAVNDRAGMKRLFSERRVRFEKGRETLRDRRDEIARAVARQPFDAHALRTALSRLREQTGAAQADLHETFTVFVQGLSDEQRARLAESPALRGRHPRRAHGADKHRAW